MIDISWGELVLIGIVALIVIGPKELPAVLRTVGHWMAKVRRMASEFQDQFREAMREAELDDLKKKVDDMSDSASNIAEFDPIGSIRKEFEGAAGEPPHLDDTPAEAKPAEVNPAEPESASAAAPPPPAAAPQPEPAPTEGRKTGDAA
jgi:sec-independent protein translocase protein TatB